MTSLLIVPLILLAGVALTFVVNWIRDRPRWRTSARDRLLARNPMLSDGTLRWSKDALRVRVGRTTRFVVASVAVTALTLVNPRPQVQ